jgi:hypothetical protein
MIHRFNVLSRFVVGTLISEGNVRERAALLKKCVCGCCGHVHSVSRTCTLRFVKTGEECRALNNFNAVFAIVAGGACAARCVCCVAVTRKRVCAGLNSAPCHRLSKTWALLSDDKRHVFDALCGQPQPTRTDA